MDKNIKALTNGTLDKNLYFKKKVNISFDDLSHDKNCDYNVLVQIEPPSITDLPNKIPSNCKEFDLILTWYNKIIESCENTFLFPFGSCWINESDRIIHSKTKNISIIASSKRMTEGHKMRHDIINNYSSIMDVYGRGYNFIENKIEGLKEYRFSIIIENEKIDNWFTEKIIDCMITGTIPIYWGCENISSYFNTNGFFIINNIEDVDKIIPNLNDETYNKMLPFVIENFNNSLKYADFWYRVEDIIDKKLNEKYDN